MEITDENEWMQPLPAAARQLHELLSDVDAASEPPWQRRSQKLAAQRYEHIFLPMLAAHLSSTGAVTLSNEARPRIEALVQAARARLFKLLSVARRDPVYRRKRTTTVPLDRKAFRAPFLALGARKDSSSCAPESKCPIPSLDVALCWASHRLSPRAYDRDCMVMFGARLPAPFGTGLAYVCARNANTPSAAVARLQWECFARAARGVQPRVSRNIPMAFRNFLPPYLWPRHRDCDGTVVSCEGPGLSAIVRSALEFDMKAAALRQKEFFYSVATPYYNSGHAIVRAVMRYERFLKLMKKNMGVFLVPLYDIDLVWHAHILNGSATYAHDTEAILRRFLEHEEDNDRSVGGRQQNGYARTVELWEREYGEQYADEHTQYRGNAPTGKRVCEAARIVNTSAVVRAEFINPVVCLECTGKQLPFMTHPNCVAEVRKKIRLARVGQAQGGACGALYATGFVERASIVAKRTYGGACGGAPQNLVHPGSLGPI